MYNQQLIGKKVFKLSTGEEIGSSELGKLISDTCHYIKYVVVKEDDKQNAVALVFPNKEMLNHPDYELSPEEGCFCPRSLDELGRCLSGCLKKVKTMSAEENAHLKSAALVKTDIDHFSGVKSSSQAIIEKYKDMLLEKYGSNVPS